MLFVIMNNKLFYFITEHHLTSYTHRFSTHSHTPTVNYASNSNPKSTIEQWEHYRRFQAHRIESRVRVFSALLHISLVHAIYLRAWRGSARGPLARGFACAINSISRITRRRAARVRICMTSILDLARIERRCSAAWYTRSRARNEKGKQRRGSDFRWLGKRRVGGEEGRGEREREVYCFGKLVRVRRSGWWFFCCGILINRETRGWPACEVVIRCCLGTRATRKDFKKKS